MSSQHIYRTEIVTKEVEVPTGHVVCRNCDGRGYHSKYDEGWRSIVHDANLAALRRCFVCNGLGYIPEGYYKS